MTFDTFARILRKRLTNLCYKTKFDSFGVKFYFENYYNSTYLFNIKYTDNSIKYAESPVSLHWTPIKDYSFINLKKTLYTC